MIMRCTLIVTGLVLSSIVFATVSAQAQVSIDVSKITCDEYVHDKIPTSDFVSFSAVGSLPLRLTRSARMTQLGSALGTDKRVVKSFCCLLTDLRQFDILQYGPGLLAGTECNLIK
jgi:hypothetical protein